MMENYKKIWRNDEKLRNSFKEEHPEHVKRSRLYMIVGAILAVIGMLMPINEVKIVISGTGFVLTLAGFYMFDTYFMAFKQGEMNLEVPKLEEPKFNTSKAWALVGLVIILIIVFSSFSSINQRIDNLADFTVEGLHDVSENNKSHLEGPRPPDNIQEGRIKEIIQMTGPNYGVIKNDTNSYKLTYWILDNGAIVNTVGFEINKRPGDTIVYHVDMVMNPWGTWGSKE